MGISGYGLSGEVLEGLTDRSGIGADNLTAVKKSLAYDFANDQSADGITYTGGANGTYFDSLGVMQTSGTNAARFDHTPSTGAQLGLLMETARTNTCFQSEDFNTTWTKTNVTVGTDAVVAPDGNTTMDNVLETAVTDTHEAVSNTHVKAASAESWTCTVFAKADLGRDFLVLVLADAGLADHTQAEFNISTGTISVAIADAGTFTNGVASIQDIGGGIYRCRVSVTTNADAAVKMHCRVRASTGVSSYLGDITKGMSLWGAMMEQGAQPSSYIKTTTGAVTRTADVATIATSSIPGFDGGTGSLYLQGSALWLDPLQYMLFMNDGAADVNNSHIIYINSLSNMEYQVLAGSVPQAALNGGGGPSAATSFKVAVAWATNNFRCYFDGTSAGLDTSGTVPPGQTTIQIGDRYDSARTFNGHIARLIYWPERLPDAELQGLSV